MNNQTLDIERVVEPYQAKVNDQERYNRQLLMSHLCAYQLAGRLAQGKRMLEVGCGSGYGAYYLSHLASEVAAIDLDAPVIAQAQQLFRRPNLRYLHQDGVQLGFPDGAFDCVGTFQVIEHIPEPRLPELVRELSRVLVPGGVCVISTLNVEHNRKGKPGYQKAGFHEKEFTASELQVLLSSVFPEVTLQGLYPRWRYRLHRRLRRWGLQKYGTSSGNPVRRFFNEELSTKDHVLKPVCTVEAIDLIAVCRTRQAP